MYFLYLEIFISLQIQNENILKKPFCYWELRVHQRREIQTKFNKATSSSLQFYIVCILRRAEAEPTLSIEIFY